MRQIFIGLILAVLMASTVTFAQDRTIGNVKFKQDFDPITQRSAPEVTINSDNGNAALMWWCSRNTPNEMAFAFMFTQYFMGSDGTVGVAYRFSEGKPIEERWGLLGNRAARLSGGHMREFTKLARVNKAIMIRATDRDGDTVTAGFQLDGLGEALKLLPCYTE